MTATGAMISNPKVLIAPEVGRRRGWPKASAGCLLSLAAAPTFLIMALLTGVNAGGVPDGLCSAAHDASRLTGMVPMYVLMSAFHLAPWLRLLSTRR
jgi:hypothetical protein